MNKYSARLDKDDIISAYESGLTQEEVAGKLGCHVNSVRRIMKLNGVSVRPKSRTLSLDETFFDSIDTVEKAYWLGLMLADGTIGHRTGYETPTRLVLGLQWSDAGHVRKFRDALHYSGEVREVRYHDRRYRKTRRRANLSVSSQSLCRTLIRHGWDDFKKCGDTRILDGVMSDLKRHLVRGLIDGDGSISCSMSGKRSVGLHFTDLHKPVVRWFSAWIKSEFGIEPRPISRNGKSRAFAVRYNSIDDVKTILTKLYSDGPWMDRKKLKADEVMKVVRASQMEIGRKLKHAKLITVDGVTNSISEWCRRLGIGRSTYNSRLARGSTPEQAVSIRRRINQFSETRVF